MKKLTKGVKVTVADGKVSADLAITIDYGHNIPVTSQNVQKKVKNAIENMTGLEVSVVNVRIANRYLSYYSVSSLMKKMKCRNKWHCFLKKRNP